MENWRWRSAVRILPEACVKWLSVWLSCTAYSLYNYITFDHRKIVVRKQNNEKTGKKQKHDTIISTISLH